MTTRPIDTLIDAAEQAINAMQDAAGILKMIGPKGQSESLREAIFALQRSTIAVQIEGLAEDGKVALIESGRDCDGVRYSGVPHIIDASLDAYTAKAENIAEWADGPFSLSLCSVSEAKGVKYESRDLVMEAHEDGHPHVIYSAFP